MEQVDHELAKLYELPWGEIAVAAFAELTVLRSGGLITDSEMRTSWGDVLDLSDPKECSYYDDLIYGWPEFPPKFLNHWLTHHVPLRPRQEEGAIFAIGRGSVPAEYHDHHPEAVKLFLMDRERNELSFHFRVRVDRSVKRRYESRRESARSTKRVPVLDPADNLYGTVTGCTDDYFGTVFKLTSSDGGWTYTPLYHFTHGNDGAYPSSVTLDANGNLYGTAEQGGAGCAPPNGCGVVWEITPN